ncbi:hypothetical protein WMW72_16390 [Paenibacillus filicis]|uniref:Legume lectin domain-containing protein n=1 Tax=Paenibacillus filicis TaxID=669464 RepID=A0ABU9DKW6_9BACL
MLNKQLLQVTIQIFIAALTSLFVDDGGIEVATFGNQPDLIAIMPNSKYNSQSIFGFSAPPRNSKKDEHSVTFSVHLGSYNSILLNAHSIYRHFSEFVTND